jgi:hypothetical protein
LLEESSGFVLLKLAIFDNVVKKLPTRNLQMIVI